MPSLSVPVTNLTSERLAKLAKSRKTTPAKLASEALTHYVKTNSVNDEGANDLLADLEHGIELHWARDPGLRTGVENIILATMAVVREVNNGGFDQFFRNTSKRWAFFANDAFLHGGRRDAAKIVGKAVRAIRIPKDAGAMIAGVGEAFAILDQKMRVPDSRRDSIFNECDVAFQQLTGLPESILAYAKRHSAGILRT